MSNGEVTYTSAVNKAKVTVKRDDVKVISEGKRRHGVIELKSGTTIEVEEPYHKLVEDFGLYLFEEGD